MNGSVAAVTPLPPHVRADGAEGRKLYEAALGFESILVRRLAEGLARSAGAAGDEDEADAASSAARDQLPDALAAVMQASGGLGLADRLYADLRQGALR